MKIWVVVFLILTFCIIDEVVVAKTDVHGGVSAVYSDKPTNPSLKKVFSNFAEQLSNGYSF